MSAELDQFLAAYDEHRVADQVEFYERRVAEYERSATQTAAVNGVLLFVAGVCGAAGVVWTDHATWLGVVAAGLAATAAAVLSWADVIGFKANAELYGAARSALAHLRPRRPVGEADAAEVGEYITDVEEILLGEVRTWGQKWRAEQDSPS